MTCSTLNFQRSSGLWTALADAAAWPEIALRVYLDAAAVDDDPPPWLPTTREVSAHFAPGVVLRRRAFDGACVRNHAKFLAIDHRFLPVTGANFSWGAEHGNVEFGMLADKPNLTEAVQHEMRQAEDALYERVRG